MEKVEVATEPRTDAITQRVMRGGVWVVAGKLGGVGFALLVNMMLARVLEPPDFGQFLLILSFISCASIFGRFGLDRSLIIYISESLSAGDGVRARQSVANGFRIGFVTAIVTGIAFFLLLSFFGVSQFKLQNSLPLFLLTVIALMLVTWLQLIAESLRGYHELLTSSLFDAQTSGPLLNIVFLLLLAVFLVWRPSLTSAVGLYALAAAGLLPFAALHLRVVAARETQRADISETSFQRANDIVSTLGSCLPITISQVLTFASANAAIWIAGSCLSTVELALFGAAWRLVNMVALPLSMVNLSVMSSIPELYAQNRVDELQRLLRGAATLSAIPSALVLLVLIVLPRFILSLCFGSFFADAAVVVVILCVGQLCAAWTGSCNFVLMMTGHHNVNLVINLISAPVLILCGIYSATHFGLVGLAVTSAAVLAAGNIACLLFVKALIGIWTHPEFRLPSWVRDKLARYFRR